MTDKIETPAPAGVFGAWLIAGTPVQDPYPCRCHERRFRECSAVFCPCAGRPDPLPEPCCSSRFGPAQVVAAGIEWRIRKMQRAAAESGSEDG